MIPSLMVLLMILLLPGSNRLWAQGRSSPLPNGIGPGATWNPSQEVWSELQEQCRVVDGSKFVDCVAAIMEKNGAATEAVAFTRLIGGEGYVSSFHERGRVDVVSVAYPFRANDNDGILLVNGVPRVVDVDDWAYLRHLDIRKDRLYLSLVNRFPKAELWTGHHALPKAQRLPDGGQRFVLGYPLLNGCHACELAGTAEVAFDFDRAGKFLGTKLVRLRNRKTPARRQKPKTSGKQERFDQSRSQSCALWICRDDLSRGFWQASSLR